MFSSSSKGKVLKSKIIPPLGKQKDSVKTMPFAMILLKRIKRILLAEGKEQQRGEK